MTDPHKSALALAIEKRPERLREFDVSGFFGLGDSPINKVQIRTASFAEEYDSVINAHKKIQSDTESGEAAREDTDITVSSKTVEILWRTCRDIEDPKYNAFPSPDWMRKELSADLLGVLLNLQTECRIKDGPVEFTIDHDQLEAYLALCAEASPTDLPETLLARCPREWLTQAFVLLSLKVQALREELRLSVEPDADDEPPDTEPAPDDVQG